MLSGVIRRAAELLFPPKCAVCSSLIEEGLVRTERLAGCPLCRECYDKYASELRDTCPKCGCRAAECECGADSYSRGSIFGRRSLSLVFYAGYDSESERVTERLIFSMKRDYSRTLIDFFARDVSAHLMKLIICERCEPDSFLLTYPPRSEKSALKYGFDQAEELTARISHYMGIPMDRLLGRVSGVEQKTLSGGERMLNVTQSIYVKNRNSARGKRIILFDDVITTGATMELSAELLLAAGAESVFPVSIAKTKRNVRREGE